MRANRFKVSLFLSFSILGLLSTHAHADCALINFCDDGDINDVTYSSKDMANVAASAYADCRLKTVSPTELTMCNPGKSDKPARAAAAKKQESDGLKEVQHTLLNIGSSGSGGCKTDDLGDYDKGCVNYAKNLVLTHLKDAAKAHPELKSAIDALSQPCPAEHLSTGVGSKCTNAQVNKALATIEPLAQKLEAALPQPPTPALAPQAPKSRAAVSPKLQSAPGSGSGHATSGHSPSRGGSGSATGSQSGKVTPDGSAAPAANGQVLSSGVTAPAVAGAVRSPAEAAATASAIKDSPQATGSSGNAVVVKPDVCTKTKNIDYSKCSFVRFAGAENISNFKTGGNQVQREDFASSAFNRFDVSCPGGDPQVKAQVCFGTIECQDVPIQEGDCNTSAVQQKGKTIAKARVEMAVACSDSQKSCDNITAAECADPKKDGKQITSVDETNFAKTRRAGTSDVKSGASNSGEAQ
jgi:hypothetical protein